jgi:hypothetical protein
MCGALSPLPIRLRGVVLNLFGLKRDKVTGSGRKPDSEKINENYYLLECDAV